MTKPDVSVLIAAYNAADTIRAAIDSALAQRGISVEVIVCDDASTDDTSKMLWELKEQTNSYIFVAQHAENRGQSEALNTCTSYAHGRYFIQLDADDELAPDALAPLVQLLDTQPEYGFAYGATWIHGLQNYVYSPPPVFDREHFHKANTSLYCILYRAEAIEKGAHYTDFYPDIRGSLQDWHFILQLTETLKWQGIALSDHLVLKYWLRQGTLYFRMKEHEQAVLTAFKQQFPVVTAEAI